MLTEFRLSRIRPSGFRNNVHFFQQQEESVNFKGKYEYIKLPYSQFLAFLVYDEY